jgi:3-deoxy-D-manno-octulosonic-acid transferase
VALANAAATLAPASSSKLFRTFRARRGVLERWSELAREKRDCSKQLIWFHAPSVGEGLQARPIIELLRRQQPALQIAYSYFSPSAEKFAGELAVDIAEYLPFDSAHDMRAMMQILRPSALFFVKLDVWPNMVAAAKSSGVVTGMLSATVAPRSGRQGALSQTFLHDAYAALDIVGAIDSEHAARLQTMGVRREVLHVTGDTRFDQVRARADRVNRTSDVLRALHSTRPTVVAGSTWPGDEAALFGAWRAIRQRVPLARLIIAPHEPTPATITSLEVQASRLSLSVSRLSALGAASTSETPPGADADVVIIDSVGVLGDVYAIADIAFVGGGFHKAGLHSVLEPAAYNVPVLFGPGYDMSREARLLVQQQGARSVTQSAELADVIGEWLTNARVRKQWGARALAFVNGETGAAERSLQLITDVIAAPTSTIEDL